MPLLQDFNDRMKAAMKAKAQRELDVLRMVKSRFQMKMAETGAKELTDELALEIIGTYCKQLSKSLPDFEKAGERAKDKVEQIHFELEYLKAFLPEVMDEAETAALVEAKISELELSDPSGVGRLMGTIMKDYKGRVDAGLVKRLAAEKLAG